MPSNTLRLLRLNRALAQTGICSRRKADEFIKQGRVKVNGKPCSDLNTLVDPKLDRLEVDERPLSDRQYIYVLLYKPKGVVTTCADEKGRKSVIDLLPESLRHLKPAGRLDRDSQGLLLLTNDGALIQTLTHPSRHVPKIYLVTVEGKMSQKSLATLKQGVVLDGTLVKPKEVLAISPTPKGSRFQITLLEGKNRQVRRMCGAVGLPVLNLIRVGLGELQLSGLEPGTWRYLSCQEINQLRVGKSVDVKRDTR